MVEEQKKKRLEGIDEDRAEQHEAFLNLTKERDALVRCKVSTNLRTNTTLIKATDLSS